MRAIFLLGLLWTAPALGQTLQEQERQRALDDFDNASKAALQAVDNLGKAKKRACLTAVANEALCSCLSEKLPLKISFSDYVAIVTVTKEELGYEKLSPDDKKIVDLTRGTRDQCIK